VHGSGKQNGWFDFPVTKTLNFLWHFPVSPWKFLRCSYLLERHFWLPAKGAESCLCGLNRLQLPSLSGAQKKKTCSPAKSAPKLLAELLESFLKPKAGLMAFPLKLFMLKKLGLQLINSAVSENYVLKGFFFLPSLLNSIFLAL